MSASSSTSENEITDGGVGDERQKRTCNTIIEVVLEILRTDGYEEVRIRDVAKRARVSMATIYRFFPTRDDLIVGALEHWIEDHWYPAFEDFPPYETLAEGFNHLHDLVFKPWVEHPKLLESYHLARMSPSGRRLDTTGMVGAQPVAEGLLKALEPEYANDLILILLNLVHGVIARFAVGEIEADEILPLLERAVYRLTSDNASLAANTTFHPQSLDLRSRG